jgi:HD-like signal output (HDOD) protein
LPLDAVPLNTVMKEMPHGLEQWLAALEHLQPPLRTELRSAALTAIDKGCSAAELADRLLADPAAVLLVFREANAALARYDREAYSLEHAIGLLGMARVQKALKAAPTLSIDHPFTREYRQAQQRSQHAAWQARLWAEGSQRWPAEELYWDALLAGVPHWVLWLEAGPLRLELSKLRAQRGFVTAAESRALFGCDLDELMAELARRWRLPRNSQRSWDRAQLGHRRDWIRIARAARLDGPPQELPPSARELAQQPHFIVAIANLLAVEADWDWYSRHFMRLLSIVATCCRRPLATLINFTHQTAASFSRHYVGDIQTPGSRLLCQWQQARIWAVAKPKPAPAAEPPVQPAPAVAASTAGNSSPTEPPAPVVSAATRALATAVRRLQQPASLQNARDALLVTLDGLHHGVGLGRVAALAYRADTRELQVLGGHGLTQSAALRQLRFNTRGNALIEQLLRKPVCLRIDADNRQRYWPLLPEALRNAVRTDPLLLSSIVVNERPLALLFADNNGAPLDESQQRLFRQLGAQLGQCLAQMGQARG